MEFLLEILTEEMPPSHLRAGLEQLRDKVDRGLADAGIAVAELKTLGTPRRLVLAGDMAPGQADRESVITGPPKSVAVKPDGSFGPAALGFARSQGVPVESLEVVSTPKGEYMGFKRRTLGRATADILKELLPGVLGSLAFPKTMRWGESAFRFSRPLHNILCILGGEVLEFVFEGLAANDTTRGHRILAPRTIRVRSRAEYLDGLRAAHVIVDPAERRAMVEVRIEGHLTPLKARLHPDPGLLEYLVDNIEHPYVILGAFPDRYLSLPLEVLSTSLREGQRLLSVVREKKQLPLFLGVADAIDDPRSLIRAGNERVLKARLEDARFFWEQDRKVPLADRATALRAVLFQEKLGSYDDKSQRLKKIVAYLCEKTGAGEVKEDAVTAASLCKADLLTEMVKEFTSLQGRIGGVYARQEGYPAAVSRAIYEHYQPAGLEDEAPASLTGALLSVADKMDTVVGAVGVGLQVTGSSDPFGLRRSAFGVCRILVERMASLSFMRFLDKVIAIYGDRLARPKDEIRAAVGEIFAGRLRYLCESRGFRYDIVNAAFGPGLDDLYYTWLRVKSLDALKASPQFEPFILMAKRVNNILRDQPTVKSFCPDLIVDKEERDLATAFGIVRDNAAPMIAKGDFARAQAMIFKLQPCLNAFFDKVLVMAPEKKLRQNRLGLLQAVRGIILEMADYSQVVVEGEKAGR
jgi:glycyl-tRNA synthetase beta chain